MNTMKRILYIFIILILLINGYLFYKNNLALKKYKLKKNIKEISKIKKGMDSSDVLEIVGSPDLILDNIVYTGEIEYLYNTNIESKQNIRIIFDSNMIVKEKYFPE
jgi:outer membrane protein assembly factor BamE (lipoprotein component of BamABCDE complex)